MPLAGTTGQGNDVTIGVSGSYGFTNFMAKSVKHDYTAKKKEIFDGQGNLTGYKYYDFRETLDVEAYVESGTGNTGTIQSNIKSIGTTITVSGTLHNHHTGSWSLDKIGSNAVTDDVEMLNVSLFRSANITPV